MKKNQTLTDQQLKQIGFSRDMLAVLREHGIIAGAPTPGGWTFSQSDLVSVVTNGAAVLVAAAAIAEGRDRDGASLATLRAAKRITLPPVPGMPPQPPREHQQRVYNRAEAAAALSMDVHTLEMALGMMGISPDDQGNYSASDVAALGKALKRDMQ